MSEKIYEYGNKHGRLGANFCLDVFAHGYENLLRILSIAFCHTYRYDTRSAKQATHYLVDEEYGLVFFQAKSGRTLSDKWNGLNASEAKEFIEPLAVIQATDFAWKWLQETEYPCSAENEGGAIEGWRVYNEDSGIIGGCWESIIALKPFWIYIGK